MSFCCRLGKSRSMLSWTCIFLSIVVCVENVEQKDNIDKRNYRAPSQCPSLSSCCNSKGAPETCLFKSNQQNILNVKKDICPLPDWSLPYNAVNLTSNIFYIKNDKGGCSQASNLTWIARPNDYVGFLYQSTFNFPARNVSNHKERAKRLIINKSRIMPGSENRSEPMLFYYDCQRLGIASSYVLELYGLRDVPGTSCLRPELIGVTTLATTCDTYPEADTSRSKWIPFVNINPADENSTIILYFSPAPHSFGFTSYHVLLLSTETKRLFKNASGLHFTCTKYGAIVFKQVCSGNYTIQITAFGGKCPCHGACDDCDIEKGFSLSGSKYSCPSNILLEVQPSGLSTVSADDLSTEIVLPDPEANHFSESTELKNRDSVKPGVIIIVVFGAVICLGVLVAFIVFSRKWKGSRLSINVDAPPAGKKPSVLLIYANDNTYHCNVVRCFASYLQRHCSCEVKFDQWCPDEISEISALDWLLQQIRSNENFIIINSEGGWRQYDGEARNCAFQRIKSETPLDDMFLLAIKELRNKRQNLFKVSFPYTHSRFFINDGVYAGRTYVLMDHIEDLFLGIQQLSKHTPSGRKLASGINASTYNKCKEGQLLETAIKDAGDYLRATPDWFSKFYCPKDENKEDTDRVPLRESPVNDCCSSPVFDSGLGHSIDDQRLASSMLKLYLDDERSDIEFYPPSDLDGDEISVTSSKYEAVFEIMNTDYEGTMT